MGAGGEGVAVGSGVGVAVEVGVGVGVAVGGMGVGDEVGTGLGVNVVVGDSTGAIGTDGVLVDVGMTVVVGVAVSDGGTTAGVLRDRNIAIATTRTTHAAPISPTTGLWDMTHNRNLTSRIRHRSVSMRPGDTDNALSHHSRALCRRPALRS
jgi:hypothetical protein